MSQTPDSRSPTAAPASTAAKRPRSARPTRRRLAPEDREHQIVQAAIALFARDGFAASTRQLATQLGVTQPLLYRYFPTKEALVDRVYEEVFVRRWNPVWEDWLADRSQPLGDRIKRYFRDYARFILRSEWVRIFIYSGLARGGVNQRYMSRLRDRHLLLIARELRHDFQIPAPRNSVEQEEEVELIWALHASIFYLGIRKWVYNMATPKNLDRLIDMRVDAFLLGVPDVLRAGRPRGRSRSTR